MLLTGGFFIAYYFTDIRDRFRLQDVDNFKGQTTGFVISVKPIERMTQSKRRGTQIFVDSYKILYNYTIQGRVIEKTDIIPVSSKNQKFLRKILGRRTSDTFLVKFDINDPSKSLLIESE
jgi:hypothetical protein